MGRKFLNSERGIMLGYSERGLPVFLTVVIPYPLQAVEVRLFGLSLMGLVGFCQEVILLGTV